MALANIAELGLVIDANGVLRATSALHGMTAAGARAESGFGRLKTAASQLGVALGAGAIFGSILRETIAAQNAMAQLEAAVRSTGGSAGRSMLQLAEFASQMQRVSTYSDEAVMGAQAILLTFDKLNGATFDRATRAVVDLATRMGGDLPDAAKTLGKALQDPERGLTALRRAGLTFSDEQARLIKRLDDTGRSAQAQAVILGELERRIGGSAAAARDTLGGALTAVKNAFGDLLEVSRDGSATVVDGLNAMAKAIQDNADAIRSIGVAAGVLAGSWAALKGVALLTPLFAGVSAAVFQLQASFAGAGVIGLTGFARLANALQWGLLPALGQVFGKLSLIVASVWALYRVYRLFGDVEAANRGERRTSAQALGGQWAHALAGAAATTGRPTGGGGTILPVPPEVNNTLAAHKSLVEKTTVAYKALAAAIDAKLVADARALAAMEALDAKLLAADKAALHAAQAREQAMLESVGRLADESVAHIQRITDAWGEMGEKAIQSVKDAVAAAKHRGGLSSQDLAGTLPTVGGIDLGRLLMSPKSLGLDLFNQALQKFFDFSKRAEEAAAALREAAREAKRDLLGGMVQLGERYGLSRVEPHGMPGRPGYLPGGFEPTALGQAGEQAALLAAWRKLAEEANAAYSGSVPAEVQRQLRDLLALAQETIRAEWARKQKEWQEDYRIRAMRAAGLSAEADALAFAVQQQREYAQAVRDGADEATQAALKEAQRQEAIARSAEVAIAAAEREAQAAANRLSLAQQALDATQATLSGIREYAASLRLQGATPAASLATRRSTFEATAARALAGDVGAAEQIRGAGDAFLEASRSYNASSIGYQRDLAAVQSVLAQLETLYGARESVQQRTVDLLSAQADAAQSVLQQLELAETQRQADAQRAFALQQYATAQAAGDSAGMITALETLRVSGTAVADAQITQLLELRNRLDTTSQAIVDSQVLALLENRNAVVGAINAQIWAIQDGQDAAAIDRQAQIAAAEQDRLDANVKFLRQEQALLGLHDLTAQQLALMEQSRQVQEQGFQAVVDALRGYTRWHGEEMYSTLAIQPPTAGASGGTEDLRAVVRELQASNAQLRENNEQQAATIAMLQAGFTATQAELAALRAATEENTTKISRGLEAVRLNAA